MLDLLEKCRYAKSERSLASSPFMCSSLEIASRGKSLSRRRCRGKPHVFTRPCIRRAARSHDGAISLVPPISIHASGTIGHLLSAPSSNSARDRSVKVPSFVDAACGILVRYEIVSYARKRGNYPQRKFFLPFSWHHVARHSSFYREKYTFCWFSLISWMDKCI